MNRVQYVAYCLLNNMVEYATISAEMLKNLRYFVGLLLVYSLYPLVALFYKVVPKAVVIASYNKGAVCPLHFTLAISVACWLYGPNVSTLKTFLRYMRYDHPCCTICYINTYNLNVCSCCINLATGINTFTGKRFPGGKLW